MGAYLPVISVLEIAISQYPAITGQVGLKSPSLIKQPVLEVVDKALQGPSHCFLMQQPTYFWGNRP